MKQINELWPERLQAYIKELRRYFKYMFNDHLLFVLIFGGGAAIYYYSEWVKTLDSGFPVGLIMAIVLAILLAISPIQTLLREADIVFLLPLETKMGSYFKNGMKLSFITQAYVLLLVLAAFMPMYAQVTGDGFKVFFYLLAIVLLLKIWNLMLHWMILKANDKQSLFFDWIIRFSLSALLLYFIFEKASFWFVGATTLILLLVTLYFRNALKNKPLKWELLIEKEQNRMQNFYRAANMFTDVPHLKGRVKRRRWLDPLFSTIPFSSDQTYRFLLSRTIVRTSEFSGLILRLTLIPVVLILFNGNVYFSVAISLLFIYLTGFQLIPLMRRHELKIWTSLYPIRSDQKKIAFLNLLMKILIVQAIVFSLSTAIGGNLKQAAINAVVSCLFAILFTKMYVPGRLKKLERR
ncbi:ABC transporter permease [Lederbergia lenta]|uniref:ABC transporter EcsB n=1 Tax=Lederbergia lenta TaxID=1467 RepID=A0A2X4W8M6_LEDLE|nr:ABC transporter permease [Lederbergia lenta]MCM3110509.1 ABC transporter permease [Lederbergia lenta]MEC2323925.1 ABC transporter permease [Lederbergia lenta]SQI61007.1 ABC transporter EcsB [Lederbergia lenta]